MENTTTYENDELEAEAYQELINSGQAWQLEGAIGRAAMSYIDAGLCTLGETGHRDYYGNYVPSKHEVKPGTKGSQEYCDRKQEERDESGT